MPINYQKGKIYKIVCNKTGAIYVGSTTKQHLSQRLAAHRGRYRDYIHKTEGHKYYTSFDILKNGDFKIVLIENCPCNSKDELLARERHFIEKLDCVNKTIPIRTKDEEAKPTKPKKASKIVDV